MSDVWHNVCLKLSINDAYMLSMVNKECYDTFIKELLWEYYYLERFKEYELRGGYMNTCREYFDMVNFYYKCNLKRYDLKTIYNNNNLKIKFCKIFTIPNEVILFKNLKELNLSRNNITIIPSMISSLTNLEVIMLDYNKIKTITTEIFLLEKLAQLSLFHNDITIIPSEISSLKKLYELDLGRNQIMNIPNELLHITTLECLNLKNNAIVTSYLSIIPFFSLAYFNIEGNVIIDGYPNDPICNTKEVYNNIVNSLNQKYFYSYSNKTNKKKCFYYHNGNKNIITCDTIEAYINIANKHNYRYFYNHSDDNNTNNGCECYYYYKDHYNKNDELIFDDVDDEDFFDYYTDGHDENDEIYFDDCYGIDYKQKLYEVKMRDYKKNTNSDKEYAKHKFCNGKEANFLIKY